MPDLPIRGSKRLNRAHRRARRRHFVETLESRRLLASLSGEVFLDIDGDGTRDPLETGARGAQVYIDANDNRQFDAGELTAQVDAAGQYVIDNVPAGDVVVRLNSMGTLTQTSPTGFLGTGYPLIGDGSGTNPTQLYEMSLAGEVTPIGTPTNVRMHDVVRTNDDELFGINFNTDGIYTIDHVTGQETLLAVSSSNLVAGLAYDPEEDVVYTLANDGNGLALQSIDQITGTIQNVAAGVRAINFGSTFYDFDTATETAVEVPRQPLSPFASTLDSRSDGTVFGLQGNTLHQYSFPAAGSTATALSTLSESIAAISFGAGDQLFGVTSGSTFHPINPATGVVGAGVTITSGGSNISGITGFDIGPDGTHYLVDSTHLYTFDPVTGIATQAPNRGLPPFSPIFTSLSANGDGQLFATLFNTTTPLAQIDPLTGLATRLGNSPDGAPYAAVVTQSNPVRLNGLSGVSDLTFDTVNRRIVGFDNNSDQFFQFAIDGTPSLLSTASRPLHSWSLAFDGSNFVMFDQDDPNKTQTLQVDPDTGQIVDGFVASRRIPSEGLFHAKSGNTPYRTTANDTDTLTGFDFGIAADSSSLPFDDFPLVINELLVGFRFGGNDDQDQLVELRGEPGGIINDGTYLVIVDENDVELGEIHGIFDLSNQPLGSNGFLTILQEGSIHPVHPNSAVLQSTTEGFGGLPGGIYTDSHPLSDRIDFILGPNAYFLIETDVAPQLGDDIDIDDDGLADPRGVKANWDVLDSISLHPDIFADGQAYGDILLSSDNSFGNDPNSRIVPEGTPIVTARGAFGYAGRIGDSVGSDPDDWTFATPGVVTTDGNNRTTLFELDSGFFGSVEPEAYKRRDLDHFGESNFVGGVRGTILVETSAGQGGSIRPGSDLTILADTNDNGTHDLLNHVVDPDLAVDFANLLDPQGNERRFPLANTFDGVTATAQSMPVETSLAIETVRETANFSTPTNNFIFSAEGRDTFSTSRQLRFDFYRPVSQASIVAIGSEFGFSPARGAIEAYDADDNLLDRNLSNALFGSARETISVASANNDIAYVLAYSDDSIQNTTSGRFDRFTFQQLEPTATTDVNGQFEIKHLFPETYTVAVLDNAQSANLIGGPPQQFTVTRYENFLFNETLRPNTGPIVDDRIDFIVDENRQVGDTIGVIQANDADNQSLTFAVIDGEDAGLLLDSTTGALTVGPDANLDFESTPRIDLIVEVSDALTSAIAFVTVHLNDVNEPPVVTDNVLFVAEGTPLNSVIGQIDAFDPDFQQNQRLSFNVLGGTGLNFFDVDAATGLITLIDPAGISFGSAPELNLRVEVSDNGVPSQSTIVDQIIRIIDQNDIPVITTTQFQVAENSVGAFGQFLVDDPDSNQTHLFEVIGGAGAEFFSVNEFGTISVRPGAVLDFEQMESHTLQVQVIDSGAPPRASNSLVTISVTDVNEPPGLLRSRVELLENSQPGTPVDAVLVVDPEERSSTDYQLELLDEGDAADFDFDPSNNSNLLTVAAGADLNFEERMFRTLTFLATDTQQIDPPTRLTLTIELLDDNDPPSLITEEVVISELAAAGSIVGRIEVQVNEPDIGDQVFVNIVGGSAAGLFNIDPVTHIMTVADGATFDADDPSAAPLTVVVELEDLAGSTSQGTIRVILNNVNEPPDILVTPTPAGIVSGQELSVVIGANDVVDPEGNTFSLAIFDATGTLPPWLTFNETTRTLQGLASPVDVGTYQLTLRAFQPGPLQLFTDVPIVIDVQLGTRPLTNQRNPLDVDANRVVASVDALRVINFIGRHGSGVSVLSGLPFAGFVDTNRNGFVTAADALAVINGMRRIPRAVGEEVAFESDDDRGAAFDRALEDLLSQAGLF